jgi:hypothetical protein
LWPLPILAIWFKPFGIISSKTFLIFGFSIIWLEDRIRVMMFNGTKTPFQLYYRGGQCYWVPRENHRPVVSH